jgi:hypothetical protein
LEGDVCLWRKGPPSNWADAGGRAQSGLMQTRPKFGSGMGRAGRVGPDVSHRWSARSRLSRSGRTRSDVRGCHALARWRCPNLRIVWMISILFPVQCWHSEYSFWSNFIQVAMIVSSSWRNHANIQTLYFY